MLILGLIVLWLALGALPIWLDYKYNGENITVKEAVRIMLWGPLALLGFTLHCYEEGITKRFTKFHKFFNSDVFKDKEEEEDK